MGIEKILGDWLKVIPRQELLSILRTLESEYRRKPICPEQGNVFRAFELCPYDRLRIILMGQDPYSQRGVATGLLFGNQRGTRDEDLSPSLQVVKEAVINFAVPHNCIIFDPTLESWARQGILLLNSALTVEMNRPGSHAMLWRPVISGLLRNLSCRNPGMMYVLFGEQARTFRPYINRTLNTVLEEKHPAWYARNSKRMPGTVFDQVSKYSEAVYGEPVIWCEEY